MKGILCSPQHFPTQCHSTKTGKFNCCSTTRQIPRISFRSLLASTKAQRNSDGKFFFSELERKEKYFFVVDFILIEILWRKCNGEVFVNEVESFPTTPRNDSGMRNKGNLSIIDHCEIAPKEIARSSAKR